MAPMPVTVMLISATHPNHSSESLIGAKDSDCYACPRTLPNKYLVHSGLIRVTRCHTGSSGQGERGSDAPPPAVATAVLPAAGTPHALRPTPPVCVCVCECMSVCVCECVCAHARVRHMLYAQPLQCVCVRARVRTCVIRRCVHQKQPRHTPTNHRPYCIRAINDGQRSMF